MDFWVSCFGGRKGGRLLPEIKKCCDCLKEKSLGEFHRQSASKDGRQCRCIPCRAFTDAERRRKDPEKFKRQAANVKLRCCYGLEPEDFTQLRKNQGDRCAICQEKFLETPNVDHCHTTKKIRGLLCHNCNRGLGLFKDSSARLLAAMEYLLTSKLS